ncbi:MAG TPA: hypothetical protein DCS93_17650 [Microscillaceae bacterium]|nr:hypothetical protein [Microscillaceae bacterium]
MKNIGFTLLLAGILWTCTPLDIQRKTRFITKEVTVTSSSILTATGDILDLGDVATDHGHCWGTTPNPTVEDNKISLGMVTNRGLFTSQITNLNPSTTYYVRAYLQVGQQILYGDDISQETPENTPAPITTGISNISKSEATAGGNIKQGNNEISQHGHCWATTPNPTIDNSFTQNGRVNIPGDYTSLLTNLQSGTLYYVRSYALSIGGISYGNQTTFRTPRN